jgi:hypothetical protein
MTATSLGATWDRSYDLKDIFAPKNIKKIGVFDKKNPVFLRNLDHSNVFRVKRHPKSQKIGENRRKL